MRLEFEPTVTDLPSLENMNFEDAGFFASPNFDELLKKGIAAAQNGDRELARKLLSQSTAINPADEDAWMWLASISEYPEELLAFLNRVLDINPHNERANEWRNSTNAIMAKALAERGLAAYHEGSGDIAARFFDQALAYDPDSETAWFWKAAIADNDGEKLEFLNRVLAINPENSDALDAVADLKRARKLAAFGSAEQSVNNGDNVKANELLDELLDDDSDPICESVWSLKAAIADTDDQKLEYLDRVLSINPANLPALDAKAAIVLAHSQAAFAEAKQAAVSGNRERALETLDKFLLETPGSVEGWLLKYHLSQSIEEKTASLEKAVEIDPDNAAARSGLAFLDLTFGSGETAAEPSASPVEDAEDAAAYALSPQEQETTGQDDLLQNADVGTFFDGEKHELPSPFTDPFDEVAVDFDTSENDGRDTEPENSTDNASDDPFDTEIPALPPPTAREPFNENTFAAQVEDFVNAPENFYAADENPVGFLDSAGEPEAEQFKIEPPAATSCLVNCPYCASPTEPQAFECFSCRAVLTLSDIESLLHNLQADEQAVQDAVTQMEADWNLREFTKQELTALSIGHFNLHNFGPAFKYLQEASRLDPNDVILSGHLNTIAIRLDEIHRQSEANGSRPVGKTILVVDDSPTVRKLISGKLEKSGHNVVCAVDGIDALEKLGEAMPDLVLLDITMPRMDGYEVCKQIRANPGGKDLPVVMISGKDGFFDKVRGRMAGTTAYVTKPFGPETLMKALETYLLPDEVEAA